MSVAGDPGSKVGIDDTLFIGVTRLSPDFGCIHEQTYGYMMVETDTRRSVQGDLRKACELEDIREIGARTMV